MRYSVRHNKSEIITAFATWVDPYPWQCFATLTFAKSISSIVAKKLFYNFIRRIDKNAIYVLAVEWFKYKRDFVHIHCLIGNVRELHLDELAKEWHRRYGINKIEPYNKELGARFYIGKYLTKDLDWDFKLN